MNGVKVTVKNLAKGDYFRHGYHKGVVVEVTAGTVYYRDSSGDVQYAALGESCPVIRVEAAPRA